MDQTKEIEKSRDDRSCGRPFNVQLIAFTKNRYKSYGRPVHVIRDKYTTVIAPNIRHDETYNSSVGTNHSRVHYRNVVQTRKHICTTDRRPRKKYAQTSPLRPSAEPTSLPMILPGERYIHTTGAPLNQRISCQDNITPLPAV